ncbi:hypothetical protein XBI1_2280094 [Xenorhabdus bovienii str. Intermedium]|uniref:Uncharacterized protein n=1 Tax=Xenorhabdus bovienii str. Intermedium TaxID=1379677 RepID=A0A077QI96_XENBV|nr:hypothetical protein XBI1_2280094 [Xenorhabdus bovienii str. Intermedium]
MNENFMGISMFLKYYLLCNNY